MKISFQSLALGFAALATVVSLSACGGGYTSDVPMCRCADVPVSNVPVSNVPVYQAVVSTPYAYSTPIGGTYQVVEQPNPNHSLQQLVAVDATYQLPGDGRTYQCVKSGVVATRYNGQKRSRGRAVPFAISISTPTGADVFLLDPNQGGHSGRLIPLR